MLKKLITIYFIFALLFLLLCVKEESYKAVNSVYVPSQESIALPIIMYHGITSKPSQVNDYFITVNSFEADLQYIKENGYSTVTGADLVAFVNGTKNLPSKPVLLSFDDGYCNNYNFAYPLLKKYNMKGVVSVIGSSCQEASDASYRAEDYCNMTWKQIEEISDSGVFEIGNHTWNLHSIKGPRKGASKKSSESEEAYSSMLKNDVGYNSEKIKDAVDRSPIVFPWPFGYTSKEGDAVLKKLGIKVTMTSFDGTNTIKKGDPSCLFNLKRQLRTPKSSLEKLLQL